ncbi:hypothetical protein [Actinomadura rudentiformis]|uniref:Uncharacterized protein n=1 Tax=Actinomadura rudentiformis TaxID=359158 RepID=A0A6H9YPH0_9ACTN|nr:hypothetical protein [Actinomadura rudentiformis]KAB2344721.1 hypothetical protein F8566_29335 [Actinomadura rudentiformis]
MSAEDDFGLWERELRQAPEPEGGTGGGGMITAAAVVTAGCMVLIMLGQAPLGTAGLILCSLILVLWRFGF